jgi:long-subunit fatty acid transport protein
MFTLIPEISWSQLTIGQYEDEAPLRTWNTFGFLTAPSLAMGETQFATASNCAVSLSNPALLTDLPKITFTLNSSIETASLFKFAAINTGPFTSDENSTLSVFSVDLAGASIRIKNWTVAFSIALLESYHRPSIDVSFLEFNQSGNLKNINFSVARKIFSNLSVGIGLNYAYGSLEKEMIEEQVSLNITITDWKYHEFQGFYINGGFVLDVTKNFKLAAVFRTPYVKKADSESLYRFLSPSVDIRIEASEPSEYKQPFVAGLGLTYRFSQRLRAASDITFYNWSEYGDDVIYFGQEDVLERDFKDIIKIGAGIEYMAVLRLFGTDINVPFRAGLSYDPQPMDEPDSSYLYFCFGTGLHWGKFSIDAGMLIGEERGSGDSLSANKFTISLIYGM